MTSSTNNLEIIAERIRQAFDAKNAARDKALARSRELIRFCQERLANYKVPRIVEFRDEIPKSPLGKILRKYLV